MKNEMPKIPNSNHKLLKKGTKLVLSAATFGVVAAGIFQGEEEGASAHHGSGCIALYHEHYRKPDPDLL